MKYLIVGLGNIGEEYWGTRHNIGFSMLNAVAASGKEVAFVDQRYGAVAKMRIKNAELLLLKPNTYMNLSGSAIRYWMQQENIPVERILVLVDDLALPFGELRLKGRGGDAGHNGLKHITATLGTATYPRLRFGIGDNFSKGEQINYVLGRFSSEEERLLPEHFERVVAVVRSFCLSGIEKTMSQYN